MNAARLVLCRPQGGLNDMLCQIERTCRYAERFDRTVVVETDYRHTAFFKDSLAKYFVSRQPRLVIKTEELDVYGDMANVFPKVAAGRINDYRPRFDPKTLHFVDTDRGEALTFDFTRDYSEPTLLHHQAGGGGFALSALSRLRLHDSITDLLITRARIIGPRYVGLHIRNTDYKTKYERGVETLAKALKGRIFVATDNRNCLTHCQTVFGAERVFSFARLPAVAGRPIHHSGGALDAYEANRDALTDMLLLALSNNCYAFELDKNDYDAKYSGFSMLALNLQAARPVLSQFISRTDRALSAMIWPVER